MFGGSWLWRNWWSQHADVRVVILLCKSTWSQNSPIYYTFQKHVSAFLCLIVFQKKTKQIFNLILKQKEHFFHSFQPFSFNHLPPFCYATPTFHYPVNSQMDKIHVSHWITSSLPRKKMRLHKWLATFG